MDALGGDVLDALDADGLDAQQEQDNNLSLVFPRGKGKRHVGYVNNECYICRTLESEACWSFMTRFLFTKIRYGNITCGLMSGYFRYPCTLACIPTHLSHSSCASRPANKTHDSWRHTSLVDRHPLSTLSLCIIVSR